MKMRMLGLFLAVFFFVSCKQKVGHYDYIDVQKPSLKEELQQRDPFRYRKTRDLLAFFNGYARLHS